MSKALRASLLLVWLIAFPYYVFSVRGLSGFKTIAITLLFVCALFTAMFVSRNNRCRLFCADLTE